MMSYSEALSLAKGDLFELQRGAMELKRRLWGKVVTFVSNYNINYTAKCVYRCPLCAFYKDEDRLMGLEEVLREAYRAQLLGATELHIVGGLTPELTVEYFENMFREIKRRFKFTIKALTATEIAFLAKVERMSTREVLERLKEAGLDAMPGGGAEILNRDVLKVIAPAKDPDEWLRVMETAHEVGIRTNATMLYGHVERIEHIVEHILKIRRLQEKTGGFLTFIPLKFKPWNTELYKKGIVKDEAPAELDARVIALARILLYPVIKNVSAYWVAYGKKYVSALLAFGASDLVGTAYNEKVFESSKPHGSATIEELAFIVRTSGSIPAQRDTFFNVIRYH